MRIAVTGASGFVGRHVLRELAKHDVEVIAIARHPEKLRNQSYVGQVLEMDIAQPNLDGLIGLGMPDVLIHLAWDGLPNYRSLHHFEQELPRHYRFLKSLVEARLTAMVVTGTCFEYGMQAGQLSESTITQPSNPYGFAKDALRKQLEFLRTTQDFCLTWGRLFYLYGDGQPAWSLYSQLRNAVSRGDVAFEMSGGEQLRDYLPVAAVARALVALAMAKENFGPINICSGKPVSVRNLVERWIAEHDWRIDMKLGHFPYPSHEPMAFWGDATRLSNLYRRNGMAETDPPT